MVQQLAQLPHSSRELTAILILNAVGIANAGLSCYRVDLLQMLSFHPIRLIRFCKLFVCGVESGKIIKGNSGGLGREKKLQHYWGLKGVGFEVKQLFYLQSTWPHSVS